MTQRHQPPTSPHALGAAIRHARKALCRRVDALAAEADPAFIKGFASIVAMIEAAFRHEEAGMETLGDDRLRDHREENAVILAALHRVLPQVEAGDCGLGRQVLAALRDLLELHRITTDLALAAAPRAGAGLHGKAARATLHVATPRHHVH